MPRARSRSPSRGRPSPATSTTTMSSVASSTARWSIWRFHNALVLRGLLAQALFGRPRFRREVVAEILCLEDLADLDLGFPRHRVRALLHPRDRFLEVLHLPDPEPRDQLLGLGERPVGHRALGAGEAHARALGARLQPLARLHDAGLHQLLVELAHLVEKLRAGKPARLAVLGRLHHHHESHRGLLTGCRKEGQIPCPYSMVEGGGAISTGL